MDDFKPIPYIPVGDTTEENPYQSPTAEPEGEGHGMLTRSDQPLNPWFSIWTKPRATMRQILDTDPNRMIWVLASITGIGQVFQNASGSGYTGLRSVMIWLAVSVVTGPIVGIVVLLVSAFLFRHTGNWLGGVGDYVSVRSAVAWSYVPGIWAMVLLVPFYGILGTDLLSAGSWPAGYAGVVAAVVFAVGTAIGIWHMVITLKCVGEAHQFSAWRALGTMIVAGLMIAGLFFGLAITVAIIAAILAGVS